MYAMSSHVEKSFEIWPGKLNLAARGAGAREALDAGMDAARELSASVLTDAEILAKGRNALPRGKAGRLALEAAHMFRNAFPADTMPPSLAAMPGAVCDAVLETMVETAKRAGDVEFAVVALGDAVAIHQAPGAAISRDMVAMPSVLTEFVIALGGGVQGGAALGGVRSGMPTRGLLDLVVTQAKSAALAGLAAAVVADAGEADPAVYSTCASRDRLIALAWQGYPVSAATGFLEPELVWQVLSAGIRRATAIREKRLLRAAALGLKGRGRTLGPVDGDRLLRFGVSEWR